MAQGESRNAIFGEDVSFGGRLRRLRETAGLTQEELASRAGLTMIATKTTAYTYAFSLTIGFWGVLREGSRNYGMNLTILIYPERYSASRSSEMPKASFLSR